MLSSRQSLLGAQRSSAGSSSRASLVANPARGNQPLIVPASAEKLAVFGSRHSLLLAPAQAVKKGFGSSPKGAAPEVTPQSPCPCGSGRTYAECCEPAHKGTPVTTPEALLRARYCAYVVKDPEYIVDTTDPASPEYEGSRKAYISVVKGTMKQMEPRALEVVKQEPGATADEAFIIFKLTRRVVVEKQKNVGGMAMDKSQKTTATENVIERSRFKRDAASGRWYYVDSSFPMEEEVDPSAAKGLSKPLEIKTGPFGLW